MLVAATSAQAQGGPPAAQPRVIVALLPDEVDPAELEAVPNLAPGLLSPGLSKVPLAQAYLDISQGNRIFTSLYPGPELPDVIAVGDRVAGWDFLRERAAEAPGDLVPGLLGQTLEDQGIPVRVDPLLVTPAILAANEAGVVNRRGSFDCVRRRCPPGLTMVPAAVSDLEAIGSRLSGDDVLIAFERAPFEGRELLAAGVAGAGFDGELTSDTTRRDGLVTGTDIAPTILERFGIEAPDEMTGSPIRAEGEPDAAGLRDLESRLSVISARRTPVVYYNLLIWIGLVAAAIAIGVPGGRRSVARRLLPLLAITSIYLPLLLFALGVLDPSRAAERVAIGAGAPLLALLTLRLFRGYAALAFACALTTAFYAFDMFIGSPHTALALSGPNPALGVRFFGIGNELEATLAVMVPVGVGAALVAFGRPADRSGAWIFLAAGAAATVVFAAGRFGADVGAAIVFPLGAAVAAAVLAARTGGLPGGRRAIALVAVVPVLAIGALAAFDLAAGGGAHLTGSVLEADGAGDIGDVVERRTRLADKSVRRAADDPYIYIAAGLLLAAVLYRRRIAGWYEGRDAAYAGYLGAAAAVVIGTLANDSAATVMLIGTGYLLATTIHAWARQPDPPTESTPGDPQNAGIGVRENRQ